MHVLVIPAWYDISDPMEGIFFHEYCNALSKEAKVTLLSFKPFSFSQRFKKKNGTDLIPEKKYDLLSVDYYSPFPGLSFVKQREQMIRLGIKKVKEYFSGKGNPDIIHIQSVCNNITPVLACELAKELKIRYVVTEHYTSFKEAGEMVFRPFTSFNEVSGIVKNASARFGVSEYACTYFKSVFSCDFKVVYNIIPDEFIGQPEASVSNDFIFLCIGGLQPRKGQTFLLEAFSKVHQELEGARLHFVGEGKDRQRLQHLIKEYGLGEKVFLSGNLNKKDIIRKIDSARVVVSASEKETFGLTLAEAFLRGKPVISAKSGGPEELINPTNGLLCEKNDLNDMVKCLKQMYHDYKNYSADQIRKEAQSKFSEGVIIPLMISNYKAHLN
jgi:glycosyltransferase involved in cell wall biosynthesis